MPVKGNKMQILKLFLRVKEEEEGSLLLQKLNFSKWLFFKKWAIPGLFSLFPSFQYSWCNKYKFCRWLDSNCGPLMSKATILPTAPQPLPNNSLRPLWKLSTCFLVSPKLSISKNELPQTWPDRWPDYFFKIWPFTTM